jgi:hypothetical protein
MAMITEIARIGVDENGQYILRLYDYPVEKVKAGLLKSIESIIEGQVKERLESSIIKTNGAPFMKTDERGN